MKLKSLYVALIAIAAFAFFAFTMPQDQKKGAEWKIPAEYKNKKNTENSDDANLKLGKATYAKHCRSCHGNNGEGDGPKARNLDTHPGNFADAKWHESVTDGEVYFMSIIGRDEMPNFESKLPDEEERWAVVNYIRAMKK